MRRAAILQHVPFEGSGRIGPWLEAAGYRVVPTRLDLAEPLPGPEDVDMVVIMGGPMSVHDTARYGWLDDERVFVGQALARGTRMLGICLGAQIIAAAAGARVYRNTEPEIGWFPVDAVPGTAEPGRFALPARADVFHWHGETFDLPRGAVHLAGSDACRHQAFQIGRSVLGLQFHVETTPALVHGLVEHCAAELVPAPHVQTAGELLAHADARCAALEPLLDSVLTFLHAAP